MKIQECVYSMKELKKTRHIKSLVDAQNLYGELRHALKEVFFLKRDPLPSFPFLFWVCFAQANARMEEFKALQVLWEKTKERLQNGINHFLAARYPNSLLCYIFHFLLLW